MTDIECLDLYTCSAFYLMGAERPATGGKVDAKLSLAVAAHWAAMGQAASPSAWRRAMDGGDRTGWQFAWDMVTPLQPKAGE